MFDRRVGLRIAVFFVHGVPTRIAADGLDGLHVDHVGHHIHPMDMMTSQ